MESSINLLPHFKPLYLNDSRYFFISSGRGAGKSFHLADFLLKLTYEQGHTILYTRYTMVSALISIIPEFMHKIETYDLHDVFEVTATEIINKKTGSNILFKGLRTSSGNQTASLKSIAGVTTVIFEEIEELNDEKIFDTIDLSVRNNDKQNRVILLMNPSFKSHWTYQRFFKSQNLNYNFNGENNGTSYIFTSYLDNAINLPQSFLDQAQRVKETNISRYNHLFLGEWLDDAEGMLWNRAIIDKARINTKPDLVRIAVALDPAVTANMNSDETGIVVVGKDANGKGYVLEDLSGKYAPNEWAMVAVQAVKNWNSDCIVAEKNQGGDMVEAVIRQHDQSTRIKLVTATKGKYVRAEPVYSLYEQSKIFHVGQFPILERQMITFDPDKGKSPDRVDALVWGFTELMDTNNQFWHV